MSKIKLNDLSKRVLVALFGVGVLAVSHQFDFMHHLLSLLFFVLYSELLIACYDSNVRLWKKIIVFILGIFYMAFGIQFLASAMAFGYIWQIFASVFAVDTAAYVFGKVLKGKLLAPKISPKKTWSGLFGGTLVGIAMFKLFLAPIVCESLSLVNQFIYGLEFALIVQSGDLLVSFAKRRLEIKDASKLLPGHGGFWDRCDSLFAGVIFIEIIRIILTGNLNMIAG